MNKSIQNQRNKRLIATYDKPTTDVIFMETEGAILSSSSETYSTRQTYESNWA